MQKKGFLNVIVPSLLAVALFVTAFFFVILPTFNNAIMERKKEMLRELIHTEYNILAFLEQQERSGQLTREEAQARAKEEVRKQHYGADSKDYFWINDMSPTMVMHPYRPELEGHDLTDYADPEGKHLFVDMVAIVREQGAGFVSYMWQRRDDPTRIEPKLSYVRGFAPWGWMIGTGVYLEDVRLEIASISRNLIIISGAILAVVTLLSLFIMRHGLKTDRRRQQAEQALQDYQARLEHLVEMRTAELTDTNALLQKEVAERQAVEKAIRNSHADLEQIFHTACNGMRVIDLEHTVIRANRTYMDLVGLKEEEVVGAKCYETLHGIACHTLDCPLTRIVNGEGQLDLEVERIRRDGRSVCCILTATPYRDAEGKLVGIVEDFKDITARKQTETALMESERRYRTVFETANDAMFTMQEGRYVECNPKTLEMFRCREEEFLGQTTNYFSPEYQPDGRLSAEAAREKIESALAGSSQVFEWRHSRCDGTTFDAEVSLNRLELSGRTFLHGIARDVTVRKKMEKELSKTQKLESIGILAGGIAHDFNNLLTVILGNVSLAKSAVGEEEEIYTWLEQTEKASTQARRLTQQLLTFAKGGAPVKKTVSVAEIIQDSTCFSLSGSSIDCERHLSEELWPVTVDDGQIRQVLQNLVINAAQAMPNGGTIKISAANQVVRKSDGLSLPEGRYVAIAVEDHGIGIPPSEMQKIFDPFYSTKAQGSGLGLAVAHSIITKHAGLITVASEIGKGSTFQILLPASQANMDQEAVGNHGCPHGQGKILVMDDEDLIRQFIATLLARLGYAYELAHDGQEAIALYEKALTEKQPFDLVVMDLTIPGGMGGKETIQRLLLLDPKVKALVSSGYSNDPIMTDFRRYGFCGVVVKPYNIEELSQTVRMVLGGGAAT